MLKKIISILTTITMVIGFGVSVFAADFPTWYVSAHSGLNCRTTPTIEVDNIITTFSNGTPLQIVGIDSTGLWWEVWDGTTLGYCYSGYLAETEDEATSVTSYIEEEDTYDEEDYDSDYSYDYDTPSGDMEYIGDFYCTVYDTSPGENGGYSTTSCGDNLSDVVGWAIAVDPSVIPYNTKVYIEGVGYRVARDCGGAIQGNRIDILVWDCWESDGLNGTRRVYRVN